MQQKHGKQTVDVQHTTQLGLEIPVTLRRVMVTSCIIHHMQLEIENYAYLHLILESDCKTRHFKLFYCIDSSSSLWYLLKGRANLDQII